MDMYYVRLRGFLRILKCSACCLVSQRPMSVRPCDPTAIKNKQNHATDRARNPSLGAARPRPARLAAIDGHVLWLSTYAHVSWQLTPPRLLAIGSPRDGCALRDSDQPPSNIHGSSQPRLYFASAGESVQISNADSTRQVPHPAHDGHWAARSTKVRVLRCVLRLPLRPPLL